MPYGSTKEDTIQYLSTDNYVESSCSNKSLTNNLSPKNNNKNIYFRTEPGEDFFTDSVSQNIDNASEFDCCKTISKSQDKSKYNVMSNLEYQGYVKKKEDELDEIKKMLSNVNKILFRENTKGRMYVIDLWKDNAHLNRVKYLINNKIRRFRNALKQDFKKMKDFSNETTKDKCEAQHSKLKRLYNATDGLLVNDSQRTICENFGKFSEITEDFNGTLGDLNTDLATTYNKTHDNL